MPSTLLQKSLTAHAEGGLKPMHQVFDEKLRPGAQAWSCSMPLGTHASGESRGISVYSSPQASWTSSTMDSTSHKEPENEMALVQPRIQ